VALAKAIDSGHGAITTQMSSAISDSNAMTSSAKAIAARRMQTKALLDTFLELRNVSATPATTMKSDFDAFARGDEVLTGAPKGDFARDFGLFASIRPNPEAAGRANLGHTRHALRKARPWQTEAIPILLELPDAHIGDESRSGMARDQAPPLGLSTRRR
jgi:hypothetical protein